MNCARESELMEVNVDRSEPRTLLTKVLREDATKISATSTMTARFILHSLPIRAEQPIS